MGFIWDFTSGITDDQARLWVLCIASVVVGDFAARVPWIVGTELKQTPEQAQPLISS